MRLNKMDKLLFVSYNHGHTNVADSIQNHRLIPALSEYYDIDVLQRKVKGGTEGVWSPEIYIIDRVIYKLFPFLLSVICLDKWLWCIFAYFKIRKTLSQYKYVVMVYEPYTTRHLHYMIKRWNRSKVISILYDSYLDNIFMDRTNVGISLRKKIERKIFSLSEKVFVNNEKIFNIFKERYPENSIFIVNLCGEDHLEVNTTNVFFNKPRILIHGGNIYGKRRIDELNAVVCSLKRKRPTLSKELQILLYGSYCINYDKVREDGNDDVIKKMPPKYGDEFKSIMREADGLILIDPMDELNTCFPSKLCEYYQYRKPIWGFAGKGTPSYLSLTNTGNIVGDTSELEKMVNSLELFLDASDNSYLSFDRECGNLFNPKTVSIKYREIIEG